MNNLKIDSLTKEIKNTIVLQSISLELHAGMICGLIGRNGSGKTMLIRAISGLMKPTEGKIIWNNQVLYQEIDFIPKLGVIIENVTMYPEFTGFQNLKFLAKINRIASDDEIGTAMSRVGLDPADKRIVKKYSLGMRQKLALAQAIMETPDLLLLDEPTNALDQESAANIRNVIKQEAERGAIVLIASHSKEDIAELCDPIYRIDEGILKSVEYRS